MQQQQPQTQPQFQQPSQMQFAAVPRPQGSLFWGSFWMLVLSILLFWLPGLGSLIAGIVGGKVAGSAGRGFLASLMPSLLFGVLLSVLAQFLVGIPWLTAMLGLGGFVLAIAGAGIMVIGALIGGLLA